MCNEIMLFDITQISQSVSHHLLWICFVSNQTLSQSLYGLGFTQKPMSNFLFVSMIHFTEKQFNFS